MSGSFNQPPDPAMKKQGLLTPAAVLALLYLCFAAGMVFSALLLPDRVATHFNLQGEPDGWMNRSSHLLFFSVIGVVLPLGTVGASLWLRHAPDSTINIPRREYWLAPERRSETLGFLSGSLQWLACELLVFLLGIQILVVRANRLQPVQMETTLLWILSALLVAAIAVWTIATLRRFRRPCQV